MTDLAPDADRQTTPYPRTYEEATAAYLEWEAQAAEGDAYEHRSNFRPDETDDAWTRKRENDFEASRDEYERHMGREW